MSLKAKAVAGALVLSAAGSSYIMQAEGVRLRPYLDSVGIPTVCVGSTRNVVLGKVVTMAECVQRFRDDIKIAADGVQRAVKVPVTQGQYDALVSFTFNVGTGAAASSTLVRKLNAGDCLGAAREFSRWVNAGGKRLAGLVTRRAAERAMFEPGCAL